MRIGKDEGKNMNSGIANKTTASSTPTPTIEEIAKKVGCSTKTVSRALNSFPKISSHTKSEIFRVARELNYPIENRPKVLPYFIKTKTVAINYDHTQKHYQFYFSRVFFALQLQLDSLGYNVILFDMQNDPKRSADIIRNVSLVVLEDHVSVEMARKIGEFGKPILMIGNSTDPLINQVVPDDELGCRLAAEHCAQQGHQHLAILNCSSLDVFCQRSKTFQANFNRLQPESTIDEINFPYVAGEMKEEIIFTHLANYIQKSTSAPTLFFCTNSFASLVLYRFLRRTLELEIPKQIGFLGYDEDPSFNVLEPPLSYVAFLPEDLGIVAARRIADILSEERIVPNKVLLPVTLRNNASVPPVSQLQPTNWNEIKRKVTSLAT
jgi:DNA-binding LacI/PurR family transcriptional regulator